MKQSVSVITFISTKFLLIGLLLSVVSSPVNSQNLSENPEVSQIFRPIAEVTDLESIEVLIEDFFLAVDPAEVEKIEIIDVTNNGFGPDDIMVIHPMMDVYVLDQPSPAVAEIMRGWNFEEQQRDATNELSSDYFYLEGADTLDLNLISDQQMMELVQNSIISDLLATLERNYNAMPISLRLERDQLGFTFQMWNYEREAFSYTPRPPATPDSIGVHDMMFVLYSDSTIVADTTYYDIMYINKTVEETIYLPDEDRVITNQFNTRNLPGASAIQQTGSMNRTRPD